MKPLTAHTFRPRIKSLTILLLTLLTPTFAMAGLEGANWHSSSQSPDDAADSLGIGGLLLFFLIIYIIYIITNLGFLLSFFREETNSEKVEQQPKVEAVGPQTKIKINKPAFKEITNHGALSEKKAAREFRDDKRHGQGTHTYPNGDRYVGEYRNNKRNGQGTYTYDNGNKYVGEWKNDKQHGPVR